MADSVPWLVPLLILGLLALVAVLVAVLIMRPSASNRRGTPRPLLTSEMLLVVVMLVLLTLDEKVKPLSFLTTGDIRRFLLAE